MSEKHNQYDSHCCECGLQLPAGEGVLLKREDRWLVFCPDCYGEREPDGTCGWSAPPYVSKQVDAIGPVACRNARLPGLTVCALHASKEALVIALLIAHEQLASKDQ